jgi:hypothetical protein
MSFSSQEIIERRVVSTFITFVVLRIIDDKKQEQMGIIELYVKT